MICKKPFDAVSLKVVISLLLLLLFVLSISFLLFSYLWVDYGLVLMLAQTRPFISHLHALINFGNTNRTILAEIYLLLIIGLFGLQVTLLFPKLLNSLSVKTLFITTGITTLIFSFAYPFLSHDIFTYLFSAKMVWVYHANPYRVAPKEFMATDLWLSFMRNIEFTYAYGPIYLLYSLIPMVIFSGKRFILNFFGIKLMNAVIFFLAGVLIFRITNKDKRVFSWWFWNPLLVVELLINSHSDLLMIALFIVAVFFLYKKSFVKAWLALIASILSKYASIVSLPMAFLNRDKRVLYFRLMSMSLPLFLQIQTLRSAQIWYYTWVYMFLPFSKLKNSSWLVIYVMGLILLIGYYPFIKSGTWGRTPLIPNSDLFLDLFLGVIIFLELNLRIKLNNLEFRSFKSTKDI